MQRQRTRRLVMLWFVVAAAPSAAQPDLLWMEQFGTDQDDDLGELVADGEGGVFIAGTTAGSLGGPHMGSRDVFIGRQDGSGAWLWLEQFGTDYAQEAYAAAPDGAGGLFVAGYTNGAFGGPPAGEGDAFVARVTGDGGLVWIEQFGSSAADAVTGLSADGEGGVYASGETYGNLGGPHAGTADVFLARLDGAGERMWIRQFGTDGYDDGLGLTADGAGGVFLAGKTQGSLGGQNAGKEDVYLARFDALGQQLWIEQFGSSVNDGGTGLAADGAGGVFIGGFTEGSLGGPSAGSYDCFLAHFDAKGEESWITQFGTSAFDFAITLTPDGDGGVCIAGLTEGALGGPSAGAEDAFFARYDAAGDRAWLQQFGSSSKEFASGLATDGAGGVFVAGPTYGSLGGPNAGESDIFLARFGSGCYADCDGGGGLDLFDFLCFVNLFSAGDDAADCDGNGALDLFDFLCFVNAFDAGC